MFTRAWQTVWVMGVLVASTAVAGGPAPVAGEEWACSPWEVMAPMPWPLDLLSLTTVGDELMAFGPSGTATSDDGAEWRRVSLLPRDISSVLRVGDDLLGTSSNTVLASSDGLAWEVRHESWQDPIFFTIDLRSIAGNDDGSMLVVVGENFSGRFDMWSPVLLTSSDGYSWSPASYPAAPDQSHSSLSAVIWTMGRFVAVGSYLLTSPDGVTWSADDSVHGTSLASSGSRVVAFDGSGDGGPALWSSDDLTSWTSAASPVTDGHLGWVDGRFWLSGRCAACADREPSLWASHDGQGWQRVGLDVPITLRAVMSFEDHLVAVGDGTAVSVDGLTWQTRSARLAGQIEGIASHGVRMVAVGSMGELLTSETGAAWERVLWGGSARLEGVAWGPAGFVAVGAGVVLTSPDGVLWSVHPAPAGTDLSLIAGNESGYVVADGGVGTWFSADGATWTAMSPISGATFVVDLEAGEAAFVMSLWIWDGGGALYVSRDGEAWEHGADTTSGLPDLAWGGGRFLATDFAKVHASTNGSDWHEVFDGIELGGLRWVDDRFVGWGAFTDHFYSSSDGSQWSAASGPTWPGDGGMVRRGTTLWRGTTAAGTIERSACGVPVNPVELPALAHLPGAEGTQWRSDLELHNPGSNEVTVGLAATVRGEVTAGTQLALTLAGGSARRLDDVLASWLGVEDAASVSVTSFNGNAFAIARTYNDTPDGTYGQLVPAEPDAAVIGAGETAWLIHLGHSADRSRGARTNIGLVNISGEDDEVAVELWRGDGSQIGFVNVPLRAGETAQVNDIFRDLTSDDVDDAFATLTPSAAGARLLCYASVVDNRSGDPIYVRPAHRLANGLSAWLPGASHAIGVGGSVWRTDVELVNPGTEDADCRIELFPWGSTGAPAVTRTYPVPAGQSLRIGDIVARLGLTGSASLRLTASAGELMANARTYAVTAEGTYGQYIPLLDTRDAVMEEAPRRLIMLRESGTRETGYRTNIGLVNTINEPVEVSIALHDASGRLLGTLTRELGANESAQLDQVLKTVAGGGAIDDAYAIVSVAGIKATDSNDAAVLAYASLIDNRTNDPVLMVATGG